MRVKEAFTYNFGHGGKVEVPAGALTQSASCHGDVDWRWVHPHTFPEGSIDRWDAEYYGVRVPLTNVEEA